MIQNVPWEPQKMGVLEHIIDATVNERARVAYIINQFAAEGETEGLQEGPRGGRAREPHAALVDPAPIDERK
jgi:hypothetical protein